MTEINQISTEALALLNGTFFPIDEPQGLGVFQTKKIKTETLLAAFTSGLTQNVIARVGARIVTSNPLIAETVPVFQGEIVAQLSTDRSILWVANGLADTDWKAINGTPIIGASSPVGVVTPDFVGQNYLSTTPPQKYYVAAGLLSSSWFELGAGGGGASDPEFANVLLLCGFEGTNNGTTFTDESSYARTLTAVGNAITSTDVAAVSSNSSLYTEQNSPVAAPWSDDFNFGSSDFTIELFLHPWSDPLSLRTVLSFVDNIASPTAGWRLRISNNEDPTFQFEWYDAGGLKTITESSAFDYYDFGTFTYIAIVCSSGTISLKLNNVEVGTGTVDTGIITVPDTGGVLNIGLAEDQPNSGNFYIDELRITALARTISATPTEAFPRS